MTIHFIRTRVFIGFVVSFFFLCLVLVATKILSVSVGQFLTQKKYSSLAIASNFAGQNTLFAEAACVGGGDSYCDGTATSGDPGTGCDCASAGCCDTGSDPN